MTHSGWKSHPRCFFLSSDTTLSRRLLLLLFINCLLLFSSSSYLVSADDYSIDPSNKSLLVALGCFWCAEQAYELYAPGVVEAVSGYAGGRNDNPSKSESVDLLHP